MDIFETLRYGSSLSTLVPVIIGVLKSRSLNLKLKLLLLYLTITAIKEILCVPLAVEGKMNLHIYNIFLAFNSIPLFLVYYYSFISKNFKGISIIFITIASGFSVFNIIYLQGLYNFNTYSILLLNFFFSLLTLLYFYELLKGANEINLVKKPMFWISVALLIYSTGTFIIFSLYEIHDGFEKTISEGVWSINSFLYIFLNSLLSIAFLCQPKNKTY